jgi:hypothetical protein
MIPVLESFVAWREHLEHERVYNASTTSSRWLRR